MPPILQLHLALLQPLQLPLLPLPPEAAHGASRQSSCRTAPGPLGGPPSCAAQAKQRNSTIPRNTLSKQREYGIGGGEGCAGGVGDRCRRGVQDVGRGCRDGGERVREGGAGVRM